MWIRDSGALGIGNESSMGLTDGSAIATPSVARLRSSPCCERCCESLKLLTRGQIWPEKHNHVQADKPQKSLSLNFSIIYANTKCPD
jgi:hypothetical protein